MVGTRHVDTYVMLEKMLTATCHIETMPDTGDRLIHISVETSGMWIGSLHTRYILGTESDLWGCIYEDIKSLNSKLSELPSLSSSSKSNTKNEASTNQSP